ncbi:C4-dicarboxylate ABC transporter permease [Desulfonema ishimotonii]|uniref:C4-dicarboxylate ABC transporter permease n=2 Tax=Desulfonema ishimotonii TaxID=45657 RepID=A0A401G213_9BACT|nr:C4-dicarboxylate ABC transporter permease [Desulfonema ishimotonii]
MRKLSGWQSRAVGGWLVTLSLFQLYTAFFGIMQPRLQRGTHLLFLLPAAFLLFPATKKSPRDRIPLTDVALAILALLPPLYVIACNDALNLRLEFVDPITTPELILGTLNIVLLLEAVRRAVVPAMAILISIFVGYLFIAPWLPGVFYCKPTPFAEIVEMQYLITDAGIFGTITGVSATFVALFVIFGAVMELTKTGQLFTDLACRLAGKSPGGPAKIAVISSGLFGSISGVAAANVYATGTFTIPLMKSLGYRRRFAGAVEAAASTGGMLMPPVMGAGAFVMAEITGVPYLRIVLAALLGSILFYTSLVLKVHFTALRENMRGLDDADIVSFGHIARNSYLMLPLIMLMVLLFRGFSPYVAANGAIAISFLTSFFKKDTMMTPGRIWALLELSGANMVMIALACAGAGMVVSIVTHTGLALGIASVITGWSGGHMFPALLLIMVTSLILGMGLPCTPAYIIAITIGGPALLSMGCDVLPAHLFVFYFAILAGITPPVCVPAYCGAAIAGSKPLQTGFEAFRLATVGFLIPYVFVYNHALLMQGSAMEIITLAIILLMAVVFLAGGLTSYMGRELNPFERALLLCIAAGLTVICTRPGIINLMAVRGAAFLAVMALAIRFTLKIQKGKKLVKAN